MENVNFDRDDQGTSAEPMLIEDEIIVTLPPDQSSRRASIASQTSSTLTPAPDILVPPTRRTPVYNDVIPPEAKFWVEINPPNQPGFDRESYEIDEEEFNVVGIFDDTGDGNGDDKIYEVQFEDDHLASVHLHN
jgi:hypothetical protein